VAHFNQTFAYQKGQLAERTVEAWCKERGFFVTRLCNIRNHDGIGAPMMMGAVCNLILPDFQLAKAGRSPFYIEVKFKETYPVSYALGHIPVHGIGRRKWEQYRRVSLLTGSPVWLLILEHLSGELLGLRIGTNDPDIISDTDKMDRGGMVFWRKSRFILIAQLERRQQRFPM
jgi:hypothetical protein